MTTYYTQTITQTTGDITVVFAELDNGDTLCFPNESGNPDYEEYLEWVALGNTATAYTVPSVDEYFPPSDSEIMFTMEVI